MHSGWGLCELDAGGHVDLHVQSFEKSFFVVSGNPALVLDGRGYRLSPGACGLIPVGMKHAWLGPASGTATWIDMNAPCPKGENFADDTYFVGPPPSVAIEDYDIRDPSSRHLFRMAEDDIKVDAVRTGLKKDAAKVSASMATALLVYSGISLKMLVDQRLDAALHTMFMVEYEPNANAHPHDHPLEEAYYIMHGEVEAWADDQKYLMQARRLSLGRRRVHARVLQSQQYNGPLARDSVAATAGAQLVPLGAGLGIRGRATRSQRGSVVSSGASQGRAPSLVVIGGTGGIGFAIAKFHADRGSNVVITGRDVDSHGGCRRANRRRRARHRARCR